MKAFIEKLNEIYGLLDDMRDLIETPDSPESQGEEPVAEASPAAKKKATPKKKTRSKKKAEPVPDTQAEILALIPQAVSAGLEDKMKELLSLKEAEHVSDLSEDDQKKFLGWIKKNLS